MTTREEFRLMVSRAVCPDTEDTAEDMVANEELLLAAWDAQAAEVERLRAEVEAERDALRTGVPLTEENAPRARVVEAGGSVWVWIHGIVWRLPGSEHGCALTGTLVARGATVLAWRK